MTWDPTAQQFAEADTLLLPDLTDVDTLNASGGLLLSDQNYDQAHAVSSFQWGAGKYGPAIRPNASGPGRWFFFPVDGLLASDQGTIEFWAMHPTLNWQAVTSKTLFSLASTLVLMPLTFGGSGGISSQWELYHHTSTAQLVQRTVTIPSGSMNFAAGTWVSVALVIENGGVRVLFNGTDVGGSNSFQLPDTVTDTGYFNQGLRFGGDENGPSGFWISDIRVSRTARHVGQTPTLKSLTGTIALNAAQAGTALDFKLGTVQGFNPTTPAGEIEAVSGVARIDKLLSCTPIKAGGTDGTHPTAGASGSYSYDWQVVDRSIAMFASRDIPLWLGIDSTPQILGGTAAPYSGSQLTSGYSYQGAFNTEVPTSLSAWGTIVGDLIHHIGTLSADVFAYAIGNEPDGGGFWAGTRPQFIDYYETTATAIRAADPTTKIIGAELGGMIPQSAPWISDLIARHISSGCALDGFTFHEYTGDISDVLLAQALLDQGLVANGLSAGSIPLYIGEFNWNLSRVYHVTTDDPMEQFMHIRAFGAAYVTAFIAHLLGETTAKGLTYFATSSTSPRSGGDHVLQLIGFDDDEHWAPYNAMKGIQSVLGDERLAVSADLPPGVYAYAGRDSATGRIGLALANYGWANRNDRTVNVTITGLSGLKRVRRWLVDPTRSSRWDTHEDDPAGSVDQDLALVSDTTGTASSLSVPVPQWGSAFVAIDTASLPKLVKLNGTPVLLP